MKRGLILLLVVGVGAGALYYMQRSGPDTPASASGLLHWIGATESETSRVPMRVLQLSDDEEVRIGDELVAKYLDWMPAGDSRIQDYVERVGARLSGRAHRKLPYRFHYIADPNLVNAFALPGGHVFIGQGLLAMMDSEDELASVLGHELEHIDHRHSAERVVLEARLRKLRLDAVGGLLSIPVQIFQAGYGKEQELEADREGTRLAVVAGYSPYGSVNMFKTFERLDGEYIAHDRRPQHELSRIAIETLEGYFRSHPASAERRAQIEELIRDEHWEHKKSERALEVIDILRPPQPDKAAGS